PTYEWSEDNSTVTATRICENDASHKETETVETVYSIKTEATHETAGIGVYTAKFENEAFEDQTIEVVIDRIMPYFRGHQLLLSGQIGVKFGVVVPDDFNPDGSYMEFEVCGDTVIQNTSDLTASAMADGGKRYYFTCYVNSVQMADEIKAVFHYGDSETLEQTYSVKQYLSYFDDHESEYDPTTLALIRAIADYGHYAQPYLSRTNNWTIGVDHQEMDKYYTESYDIDSIKDEVAGYRFIKSFGDSKVTNAGYKLHLDSETVLTVYIYPENGTEVTASCTFNGKTYYADKLSDERYAIQISNIAASLLGQTITINGDADGEFTITVSALSYARSVLNNDSYDAEAKNTLAALYKYYDAVVAYRGSH
ncbi:MAG: hypothetical protein Q4D24_11825, partial [Erysipelotrichaceae bacterium]|nr:hypothetical protein [Erysipelotrichaceae bacterium]